MKSVKQAVVGVLVLILFAGLAIFAMNRTNQSKNTVDPKISNESKNNDTNMKATIQTNKGNIVLELFSDKTPKTSGNFEKLAKESFYDGTKFHRIIENFMIQGGDPQTKDDSLEMMWGTGGPGYQFEDEFVSGLSNVSGTISMANSGPGTNGSQFFINVADNTFLDGKHTVFGKVIEGMDIVMMISQSETKERDVPAEPIILEKVTIE